MKELEKNELIDIYGGGKWSWGEAAVAYCLLGVVGVGFYYLGTCQ